MVKKLNESFDNLKSIVMDMWDIENYNPTFFMNGADKFSDAIADGTATPESITKRLYNDAKNFVYHYDEMVKQVERYYELAEAIKDYYENKSN